MHLQPQAQLAQQLQRMHGTFSAYALVATDAKWLEALYWLVALNNLPAYLLVASQAHLSLAYSSRQTDRTAAGHFRACYFQETLATAFCQGGSASSAGCVVQACISAKSSRCAKAWRHRAGAQ